MRICVVAYKFGWEKELGEHLGTYNYFLELMRGLNKQGHQVYVIAPWLSFFKKGSQEIDGIKILRYWPPLWNKIWLYPFNLFIRFLYLKITQRKVFNFSKKFNPDVIFVWQARETGYAIAKIKNKLNSPFIFRQITTWRWHFKRSAEEVFGKKNWYLFFKKIGIKKLIDLWLEFLLDKPREKKYAELIYQQADQVVFVSKIASQEAIEMGLDKRKIGILEVSIDPEMFKPLEDKEKLRKELGVQGEKIAIFIGRINFAEKGIGYLIKAMPKVVSQIPKANLLIIGGGGESQRMFELIDQLKIKDYVQTVGKKPFVELNKYINTADVLVTPSVWLETFGQVTIEGMACGLPVITSDSGASPDINLDSKTGLVVPSKNSDKLAEALIKIFKDDDLKKRLGKAARERVLNNYTHQAVVNKLIGIFKEIKHEGR